MHVASSVAIVSDMTRSVATHQRGPLRRTFLAERYCAGLSPHAARSDYEAAHTAATQLSLEGRRVTLVGSLMVPSDETVFSLFAAEAMEDVAAVGERAALPYDRITESVPVGKASRGKRPLNRRCSRSRARATRRE